MVTQRSNKATHHREYDKNIVESRAPSYSCAGKESTYGRQ